MTNRRASCRQDRPTEPTMPMPHRDNPIWRLSHAEVAVAYAVCNAFFMLQLSER